MRRAWILAVTLSAIASTVPARAAADADEITVTGWIVDSACAYTKGIDKPVSPACARACARKGSPLVVLRDDGTIFLPIDDETPAASQNPRLLPFAGERVTVKGEDHARNGSHGIVIREIARASK